METDEFQACLIRAKNGDNAALGRLLESIEARLRNSTQKRLGAKLRGKVRTSDVLQTTYVDVVKSIQSFRGEDAATFAAWVGRVLENNLRDKAKFFARERRRDVSTTQQPDVEIVAEVSDEETPSRRVMEIEHLHLVSRAFDLLDEVQRQVLQLRMIQGLDYESVARELGRSEGATRMLYSRARAALAMHVDRILNAD